MGSIMGAWILGCSGRFVMLAQNGTVDRLLWRFSILLSLVMAFIFFSKPKQYVDYNETHLDQETCCFGLGLLKLAIVLVTSK